MPRAFWMAMIRLYLHPAPVLFPNKTGAGDGVLARNPFRRDSLPRTPDLILCVSFNASRYGVNECRLKILSERGEQLTPPYLFITHDFPRYSENFRSPFTVISRSYIRRLLRGRTTNPYCRVHPQGNLYPLISGRI